ncbi:Formyltransferase [Lepidopterella palustris CBS 459.81]|uniref:methionyl-tRNA formyltransferase n=1 Tax=Lepidopterella palustris CBS 459.81 TaxID=1314670 RepID=A0A8E2ECG6_9PEZI|nr:Formyltransferase [Lepidopterella palustris CBS 459.81]
MKLLWRPRLPVPSFFIPKTTINSCQNSSTKSSDPLRILFCGSDEFSIASLRAVHKEHLRDPKLIASIDVVHRPGKRTGRGLKLVREVPIKKTAEELKLNTHEIDTFTGWKPPSPQNEAINLVVAVSFGLLVPPRILNGTKYGGLNVHPSLLPDLRGPAPIHHTLLQRRQRTGITVQTLHPKHFDQGMVLAQTPAPGLVIPNQDSCTPSQLLQYLAPLGGEMLVETLRSQAFVPPLEDVGWNGKSICEMELKHAPKIQKEDSRIDWNVWTADDIFLRNRVLGDLWTTVPWSEDRFNDGTTAWSIQKRIIFHQFVPISTAYNTIPEVRVGSLFLQKDGQSVEGGKKGNGIREILLNSHRFNILEHA